MKILLVKLKNFHTSACLQLNYCTIKQTKDVHVANKVEFIKPLPLISAQEKISFSDQEQMLFWYDGQLPSVPGDNDKNLGGGGVSLGGMIKI